MAFQMGKSARALFVMVFSLGAQIKGVPLFVIQYNLSNPDTPLAIRTEESVIVRCPDFEL